MKATIHEHIRLCKWTLCVAHSFHFIWSMKMTLFDHNECLYGSTGSILRVIYKIKALFHHNGSN